MAISDTCCCGADFGVSYLSPTTEDAAHREWLEAHSACRAAYVTRHDLRLGLPAGHPNSVHPRAEDQPTIGSLPDGKDSE